jgi:hypothetical protein
MSDALFTGVNLSRNFDPVVWVHVEAVFARLIHQAELRAESLEVRSGIYIAGNGAQLG